MGFMEAVKSVFTHYATFSGRARRSEYWYFTLFNLIVSIVLSFVGPASETTGVTLAASIYALAVLLPAIAVAVRRLHDIGKSGVWYLFNFIPLIGSIVLIIMFLRDSEPGDNQYGPNPKGC